MRKVIFKIAVSIDGFIEGPDGGLDWIRPIDQCVEVGALDVNTFLKKFDTLFYGREAYEKMGIPRAVDPALPEETREWYQSLNVMRKYVFSRKSKHVPGNGMVIRENLESEVKRIREEEGKNIWFCGGADILKTFIDLDLVDEYILAIQPVVLGSGKPLFGNLRSRLEVTLLKTQNLTSGVVLLHYEPQSRNNKRHHDSRSFQNKREASGSRRDARR